MKVRWGHIYCNKGNGKKAGKVEYANVNKGGWFSILYTLSQTFSIQAFMSEVRTFIGINNYGEDI